MRSKTSDRNIVLWLVAALFVETLLLLWHLDVLSLSARREAAGEKLAGQIAYSENDLRRRSLNSLVWEKTAIKENVYFYDSLLTLAQSTARLELERGTEVALSENTLVTIEPQSKDTGGEIRLRFTRGSVQARNPFLRTEIEAPEFSVRLAAGSDLRLSQVGEQEFEVRVEKGSAEVVDSGGVHQVDPHSLIRINRGKATGIGLDARLKWRTTPARRVYVHGERAGVKLAWEGAVRQLVVQKTGANESMLEVTGTAVELDLPLGDHRIYPRGDDGKTGAPVEVQIWRAPTLHLISPLPRNRAKLDEHVSFHWTRIPEAASYRLHVGDAKAKTAANASTLAFDREADLEWSVWAEDAQGFAIPPLYTYPLYIRDEPLAAPKLKTPVLRRPAKTDDRGAWNWLWSQLLPRAHAEDVEYFEAKFSWEPVPGALSYRIEISETPDFRTPVVSLQVYKTEFLWEKALKRDYHWRVAAAGRSGRMGLFSEPSFFSSELVKVLAAKPVVAPKVEAPTAPIASAPTPPVAVAPAAPVAPLRLHEPHSWRLLWRAGYYGLDASAEDQVKVKLGGGSLVAFSLEKDLGIGELTWWRVAGQYAQLKFEPTPASQYPFQSDIAVNAMKLSVTRWRADSTWGLGVSALSMPEFKREGLERISAREGYAGGVHVQTLRRILYVEYRGEVSLVGGSPGLGVGTSNRFLTRPFRDFGGLVGIELEAIYLFKGSGHSLATDARFQLGFEF